MIYDCKRGGRGCAVKLRSRDAEIDHRDVFLSAAEGPRTMVCACVWRFTEGRVVVDIGFRSWQRGFEPFRPARPCKDLRK
jgi:vanillate O-demethylase ferredoxin subunit